MTAKGQTNKVNNGDPVPSVAFYIGRLLPYRLVLRVIRSLLELLHQSGPLVEMLLAKVFFDTLQQSVESQLMRSLSSGGIVAVYVTSGLVINSMHLLRTVAGTSLGFWVIGLLQRNLLASILARPGSRSLPGSVGEALSTLRDDVWNLEDMDGLPLDLLTQLVYFIGGLAILLWVDIQVTLLVFIPTFVVLTITQVGRRRLKHMRTESREATAKFTGGLGEVLTSVQAIQVAGAEKSVINHLHWLSQTRQQTALRDWLLRSSLGMLMWFSESIGMGLLLIVAAGKMRSGAFTVGDFALFTTYLGEMAEYLHFGGSTLLEYRLAQVSVNRLVALLQGNGSSVPPERLVEFHPLWLRKAPLAVATTVKTTADRLENLQVDGLTLRYEELGSGINDISFTLEHGTLTAIVGRIGSGKTTLLRALLGLLPIDSGEVRWNGERIDHLASFCVPPRVAYTPQVPVLLSDTLRENILLGLPNEPERLSHAVQLAVLDRDVAVFPDGLDTLIGVRGMKLSGGQVQRAAAARMFVRESELLILDDISSALDVETEQVLWQRMFDGNDLRTCLVVSHRRSVLERADQILVMEHGRITAMGTLEELLQSSEEMRQLYVEKGGKDQ